MVNKNEQNYHKNYPNNRVMVNNHISRVTENGYYPSMLQIWPYFSSSPRPWYLAAGIGLGTFLVPGIYIETYVCDDKYVQLLGPEGPYISFPHKFTKR